MNHLINNGHDGDVGTTYHVTIPTLGEDSFCSSLMPNVQRSEMEGGAHVCKDLGCRVKPMTQGRYKVDTNTSNWTK